jgi:predicted nucleic acid-binding protein
MVLLRYTYISIGGPFYTHSNPNAIALIFQSDSLDLVTALLPVIHIPPACADELASHGWDKPLRSASSQIKIQCLTEAEKETAWSIAQAIALHPLSRDSAPDDHLGEAQAMALATRPEFAYDVLLLDELAARAVAEEIGLTLSGFAGVLLAAVQEGLLTSDELKKRLKACQQQGTYYSETFIEQVYLAAKGEKL